MKKDWHCASPLANLVHFCLARTLRKLVILEAGWNQKANRRNKKKEYEKTNLFFAFCYALISHNVRDTMQYLNLFVISYWHIALR